MPTALGKFSKKVSLTGVIQSKIKPKKKKKIVLEEIKAEPVPIPEITPDIFIPKENLPFEKSTLVSKATGKVTGVRSPEGNVFLGAPERFDREQETPTLKSLKEQEKAFEEKKRLQEISRFQQEQAKETIPEAPQISTKAFMIGKKPASPFLQASISKRAVEKAEDLEIGGVGIIEITQKMNEMGLTPEEITSNPDEQALLKLQLNEIDLQNIKEGQVKVSRFTQIVETIPLVAKAERRYIGALKTPSGEIDKLLKALDEIERTNANNLGFAGKNPVNANEYLRQAKQSEADILKMESKIKLLTIQSRELQADPEQVRLIREKILGAKLSLQNSRQRLEVLSLANFS